MSPAEKTLDHFDAEALHTLQEIACALRSSLRLRAALNRTLEILAISHGVTRSAILLRRRGSVELRNEASYGLTPDELKALLRRQDGPADRVIESGKPIVVPKAGPGSLFFRPDGTRSINESVEKTFVCVPVFVSRETSGVLLLDMRYERQRKYDQTVEFMDLVGSIIAQALRIAQLSEKNPDPQKRRAQGEVAYLREEIRERYDFSNLIGNSGPMELVFDQVAQVSRSNATVMVRGESGTGKELIAHAIHHNSLRKSGPFIKVNCAALPETLIDSELFGFEKGAFTGAHAEKKGRFELAEGGTLFLDEIGELNATAAVKLLRVLQEREFERVGGTRTLKANVRLIVATNKNLEKAIAAGSYREDLYYRLNVFAIFVPPLRERKPDVLPLANHFLDVFNRAHGKQVKEISRSAVDMLMRYHWPGNVRELSNTIERAVLTCGDHTIHDSHLPQTLQTAETTGTAFNVSLKQAVDAYEKDLIHATLKTTRGNRAQAAKLLGTTERIVNYKTRKYGIACKPLK